MQVRLLLLLCAFTYSFKLSENLNLPEGMTKKKAVRDEIMKGYDKHIRPEGERHGESKTHVEMDLVPRHILDVDETNAVLIMDHKLCLNWTDPRLKWNKAAYDGKLFFPPDVLWIPEAVILNSPFHPSDPKSDMPLSCNNEGEILWCPDIVTRTFCPALMEATYPYDEVRCNISLGFQTMDPDIFSFGWSSGIYKTHFVNVNQRWELLQNKVSVHYDDESDIPELALDYTFPIRRRPLPEIEVTRIPCILVMLLNLSVFWLPPNSSQKLLVLGFLFLVLTVLIVYAAWNTTFLLGVLIATSFLQSSMYIVVVTFFLQILFIFNLCNFSGTSRPPPSVMKLLRGPFGKFTCLPRPPDDDNQSIAVIQIKEYQPSTLDKLTPRDEWMMLAAGLDRLFFVLLLIVMIIVHHV